MQPEYTMIFAICFSLAIILILKFIQFKKRTRNMAVIDAKCTDTTLRTTYQKNIRIYYYRYFYNDEEYQTSDQTKFMIPGFKPSINKNFKIYVDPKNPQNCITPLEIYYFKITLIGAFLLLILPFLL